jgi:hypothetical protein
VYSWGAFFAFIVTSAGLLPVCDFPLQLMSVTKNILLYQSPDGQMQLDVQLQNESVWLTQVQMAELFDASRPNVTMHVRNVFKEGGLEENAVGKKSLLTATDGKQNYKIIFQKAVSCPELPDNCIRSFTCQEFLDK